MSVVYDCVLSINWTAYILQYDTRSLQYQINDEADSLFSEFIERA